MISDLMYVGITHAGAPLSVRERLQPTRPQCLAMLERLSSLAAGRLILNTCERFEVYASQVRGGSSPWIALLADWFHVPKGLLRRFVTCRTGHGVAEHMLRVAGGLDSRVLGEPQVLGQLREAQRLALQAHSFDATLAALTRTAIRTGRRIRHETPINYGRRSIATLAVETLLAANPSGIISPVVVLGSGHLARDVVGALAGYDVRNVLVLSRNRVAAEAIARRWGFHSGSIAELPGVMATALGLVACTSSASYLVDPTMIGTRRKLPLHIVDLCVPRNVDPNVERLGNISLMHLDDMLRGSMTSVSGLIPAQTIIAHELRGFETWQRERAAAAHIRTLIDRAHVGRDALSPAERKALHAAIMAIKHTMRCEEAA